MDAEMITSKRGDIVKKINGHGNGKLPSDKPVKNDYVVVVRILEDNTIRLMDPKDPENVYEFGVPDNDQFLQTWLKEHVKTVWGAHSWENEEDGKEVTK
jgi:hypothetical protein